MRARSLEARRILHNLFDEPSRRKSRPAGRHDWKRHRSGKKMLESTTICRENARFGSDSAKSHIKLFAIAYRTGCRYSTVLALEMFQPGPQMRS
jgi:hypothetical protein